MRKEALWILLGAILILGRLGVILWGKICISNKDAIIGENSCFCKSYGLKRLSDRSCWFPKWPTWRPKRTLNGVPNGAKWSSKRMRKKSANFVGFGVGCCPALLTAHGRLGTQNESKMSPMCRISQEYILVQLRSMIRNV